MTDSVWIEGYEGKYKIFADGRVQSFCGVQAKFLKPSENHKGYLKVSLVKNGKAKMVFVHTLVAKHFVVQPKLQVNHKNCNKLDNRVENLEWVTQAENTYHALANERVPKRPARIKKPETIKRPVVGVSITTDERKTFDSVRAASRFIGTHAANISACCRGRYKTLKGYSFSYDDTNKAAINS